MRTGSRIECRHRPVDNSHRYGYIADQSAQEGTSTGDAVDGAGCGSCAWVRHSARGRFRASSRLALRCRSARCSLHWCRGGSSRLHPAIPGSAARSRWQKTKSFWHSRGGAPKGERVLLSRSPRRDRQRARSPVGCACRRSASLRCYEGSVRTSFLLIARAPSRAARREKFLLPASQKQEGNWA